MRNNNDLVEKGMLFSDSIPFALHIIPLKKGT